MSTTDTQVLAALNAWTITNDPTNRGGTLDNYAPKNITAMRAALDAANLDLDRLRDGIKALIDDMRYIAKTHTDRPDYDLGYRHAVAAFDVFATALLDGEAKG